MKIRFKKFIARSSRYYIYLLPTIILLGIFSYYPPISAFYYSLFDWNGATQKFIGLNNFTELIKDRVFLTATGNMFKLLLFGLFTLLVPSLLVAELIFTLRSSRMARFYQTMFLIPTLVPSMVVILLWRFIYHPQYGLLNNLLLHLGLSWLRYDWLSNFKTALLSLVFFNFPWVQGTTILIFLAALLNISNEIIDSAKMDGATGLKRVFYVDLPLIMGSIKLVVILGIIGTIQSLSLQFVLTNGGPGIATSVPAYYMYRSAFQYGRFGYASAIGVILFLATLGATFIVLKFLRSDTQYQS